MKKLLVFFSALCCMAMAFAQTPTIVTGHPDFKVKVTRCAASGKVVVLDLVFTNVSATDVENWAIGTSFNFGEFSSVVYDSEGNLYRGNSLAVKVSNLNYSERHERLKMISDVPMKVSLQITGVPANVEALARVDITVNIPLFNIKPSSPIKIKNIPIER